MNSMRIRSADLTRRKRRNPRLKRKEIEPIPEKKYELLSDYVDKTITVNIKGKSMAYKQGYDLRYLLNALRNFERLGEKTYLFLENKNRMNEEEKENFKILISDFREGSFEADLIIYLGRMLIPIYPFIAENSGIIWEGILNTYEYLSVLIDSKKRGEVPQMENTGDGSIQIMNSAGGDVYVFPGYTAELGKQLAPVFSQITKDIDDDKVNSINFNSGSDLQNITLTSEDKERFKSKTYLIDEEVMITGKIMNPNGYAYTGMIEVFEGDYDILPGQYRFTLNENLKNETFIINSFMNDKDYICQKKVKLDPSRGLEEIVTEIKILRENSN